MARCPCCDAEVEMGVPSCPDCGLALGGLDAANEPEPVEISAEAEARGGLEWPVGEDGNTETPVLLLTAKTPVDCAVTESLLRGCGIPAVMRTPLPNQFTSVLFGGPILGADLFVPESRLAEARSLLHESADTGRQ